MASNNFLFNIPQPIKNKSYLELKKSEHSKHGCLKKKDKGVFLKSSWKEKFVVLGSGCLYIFKDKSCQTYEKAFSLFGYNEISRENKKTDGTGYPFKICYALNSTEQMKYFSAKTEKDRAEWMIAIRNEMMKVHKIDSVIESDSESSVDVTELPISSKDFFEKLKIDNVYEEDTDLEVDDSFIVKPTLPQPPPNLTIRPKQLNGNTKNKPHPNPPAKPNFEAEARWDNSPIEGQRILMKIGCEGTYMIRKSLDGLDVLLVISHFQTKKYKIFKENGQLFLDMKGKHFNTVNSLILHYRENPLPTKTTELPLTTTKLKDPYKLKINSSRDNNSFMNR